MVNVNCSFCGTIDTYDADAMSARCLFCGCFFKYTVTPQKKWGYGFGLNEEILKEMTDTQLHDILKGYREISSQYKKSTNTPEPKSISNYILTLLRILAEKGNPEDIFDYGTAMFNIDKENGKAILEKNGLNGHKNSLAYIFNYYYHKDNTDFHEYREEIKKYGKMYTDTFGGVDVVRVLFALRDVEQKERLEKEAEEQRIREQKERERRELYEKTQREKREYEESIEEMRKYREELEMEKRISEAIDDDIARTISGSIGSDGM